MIRLVTSAITGVKNVLKSNTPETVSDEECLAVYDEEATTAASSEETSTLEDFRETTLYAAIKDGDVELVREMLKQGANYEDSFYLLLPTMDQHQMEIIKLLVDFGAEVVRSLAVKIFAPENSKYAKELVGHIIKHNKDPKTMARLFCELLRSNPVVEPHALEICQLMLDEGLNVNNRNIYDDDADYGICGNEFAFTPLHMAIKKRRTDFVSFLLQNGADVFIKTLSGNSSFHLAIQAGEESILELLLEKGTENRKDDLDLALYDALKLEKAEMVYKLLKHGVNISIMTTKIERDRMNKNLVLSDKLIFIKELAKFKHEDQPVCLENFEYVNPTRNPHDRLQQFLDSCLDELQRMSNYRVHKNLTLYGILQMRTQRKRLIALTKNEMFNEAFRTGWDRNSFGIYSPDLDEIFEISMKWRDVLLEQEAKLLSVFKDHLPDLVIRRIAYFAYVV